MEELEKLLLNVSDTYDDFVFGVMNAVKRDPEGRQMLIDFIKNNPEKDSSDIMDYMDEIGV